MGIIEPSLVDLAMKYNGKVCNPRVEPPDVVGL